MSEYETLLVAGAYDRPPVMLETHPKAPLEVLRRPPPAAEPQARWDEAGAPANVEAAIADALDWLHRLHRREVAAGRSHENARRLAGCIDHLAKYADRCTRDVYHALLREERASWDAGRNCG